MKIARKRAFVLLIGAALAAILLLLMLPVLANNDDYGVNTSVGQPTKEPTVTITPTSPNPTMEATAIVLPTYTPSPSGPPTADPNSCTPGYTWDPMRSMCVQIGSAPVTPLPSG